MSDCHALKIRILWNPFRSTQTLSWIVDFKELGHYLFKVCCFSCSSWSSSENKGKNPTICNMICWLDGSMGQNIHRPSVWCSKLLGYTKMKSFEYPNNLEHQTLGRWIFCPIEPSSQENEFNRFLQTILQEFMEKNDTWNIRRLVDELFVPATKQPSVLYWRLSEFKTIYLSWTTRLLGTDKRMFNEIL